MKFLSTKDDHIGSILTFVVMFTGCMALLESHEALRAFHLFTCELLIVRRADACVFGHTTADGRSSRNHGFENFCSKLLTHFLDDVIMLEVLLNHGENEANEERVSHLAHFCF